MKYLLVAMTFAFLGGFALAPSASGGQATAQGTSASPATSQESPFACNRLALTPAQRQRHFGELGPALRVLKKSIRELPDGYEFEFPADPATIQLVAEWAAGERLCCPFFEIEIRMEKEGGPAWLRLTGRPGTKDFIKVDGADWVKQ